MTFNLDHILGVLWTQLWQLTLLVPIAIWGVRVGCRRRSHLGYVLLLAVLVKCVVPPLWSSPAGVFSWVSHVFAPVESSTTTVTPTNTLVIPAPESNSASPMPGSSGPAAPSADWTAVESNPPRPVPPTEQTGRTLTFDWMQVGILALFGFWLCGIVGVLGYLFAKRVYLERFHDDTRVDTEEELLSIVSECSVALDLRQNPDLVVTTHPTIPFVVGWWSPRLVLPKHIVDRTSFDDMRLIIAHELNHLRRWDTAINWIQLGVQAVWWFHPLVWWLNAEIRRWRESCCDEEVVARLKCRPSRYAHCLLNVLEFQAALRSTSGLASLSPFEVTKQRLQNIMHPQGVFPRSTPWSVWLAFVVLAAVVLPGAAFTVPPAVIEAHDEIPDRPVVGADADVPPPPPPVQASNSNGLPAVANIENQEAPWRYQFDVHRAYQYSVSIDADGAENTMTHTGQPVVRATYLSGRFWQLQIVNPSLSSFDVPNSHRPFGRGFQPPRIPSPFDRGYEVTIDSLGHVSHETTDSPLPFHLGDWSNWLFRPLPETTQPNRWIEEGKTRLSRQIEPEEGPFGSPFRGPFTRTREMETLNASLRDETTQSFAEGILTLEQTRTISTDELVDGEPRLENKTQSTWSFDPRLGVPVSLTGHGVVTERQWGLTSKTPYQFTVKLQDSDSAVPPAGATTATPAPHSITPDATQKVGKVVTPDERIKKGQKFLVEWHGSWFPGEVIDVPGRDSVKIHYPGWSDHWDEVVPRGRLRFPQSSPNDD